MTTMTTETMMDDICRIVFTDEIQAMVLNGESDEVIVVRILCNLKQNGIDDDVAQKYAMPVLLGLKKAMQETDDSGAGFFSSYLNEKKKLHYELFRPQLHQDETLLCVEKTEKKAPFLIRIVPVLGDLAELGIKHLLIAVTDQRVLVLQLGSKKFQPVIKQVMWSIPHSELKEVTPKRGMLTSSLRLATHDGRKMHFQHLMKSAAHRLSDYIHESLQQHMYG